MLYAGIKVRGLASPSGCGVVSGHGGHKADSSWLQEGGASGWRLEEETPSLS